MNPVHLLEQLNWEPAPKPELLPLVVKNEAPMSPILKELLLYIKSQGPVHRDQISMQFNLNNGALSSHLLNLEMLGLIQMQAGNRFVRR
jgi:predicted Rossmann fold nucleotide-binding protein DprA/Smf involved in DNA uptake